MTKLEAFELKLVRVDTFLTGQQELHKIAFAETDNDKHLEAMLRFRESIDSFRHLQKIIDKLAKEKRELKNKL